MTSSESAPRVAGIFISSRAGGPMIPLEQAMLLPGRGIEGDRYFAGAGTFSRWPGSGRELTLIEAEVLDAIRAETGVALDAGQSRRNLVTRGVRLADLVGQWFRVGPVLLHGARTCSPCKYLERLVPGSFAALKARGGLRAEIHSAGIIRCGDAVVLGRGPSEA